MIAYLKKCLRSFLKSLLADDLPPKVLREPYLDVVTQSKTGPLLVKYLIVGVIGTRLQGVVVSGQSQGVRLISEQEAVDKDHFRELRSRYMGDVKMIWEDTGEPV
jgi:hypothetical protein